MSSTINVWGRLRIERAVWMLDQRLYYLPRRTRIESRREVRQNLLVAAGDVGVTTALRQLGNGQQLAVNYLAAEYGDQPRASWISVAVFLSIAILFLTAFLTDAANGFGRGITAADENAAGTFTWDGLSLIQSRVTFTVVIGRLPDMICSRRTRVAPTQ